MDIPFELKFNEVAELIDTTYDSVIVMQEIRKIDISIDNIEDYRITGDACRSSTGGRAEISSKISLLDSIVNCALDYPGCSPVEWDTINSFAPNCIFDKYKLYLLKLDPYDENPESIDAYVVKYVLKRKT